MFTGTVRFKQGAELISKHSKTVMSGRVCHISPYETEPGHYIVHTNPNHDVYSSYKEAHYRDSSNKVVHKDTLRQLFENGDITIIYVTNVQATI